MIAHDGCHSKIPHLCGLPEGFLNSMRNFSSQKLVKSQDQLPLSLAATDQSLELFPNGSDVYKNAGTPEIHKKDQKKSHLMNMDIFRLGGDHKRWVSSTSLKKVTSASDLQEIRKEIQPAEEEPAGNTQVVQNGIKKARDESLRFFKLGTKGVGLDDFTFLAVLGKGNFGKVMLAQEKLTNAFYGIKVLKKEFVLENDEVERY